MQVVIKVPRLGESVTEAVVARILKPSGSFVKEGEEILELETEKVNQVLCAPATGELRLDVAVEQKVSAEQVVGFVQTEAKPPTPPPPSPTAIESGTSRKMTAHFVAELQAKPITPPPSPPAVTSDRVVRKRLTALRRTIAQKLVEVKNQTAMLTTFNEVDMTHVMEIRSREKENFQNRYGVRLGFMSFFLKASVAALKAFPEVASYIEGEELVTPQMYDIGVAVSTERGLLVPVVRDCEHCNFAQIEMAIEQFAKKAKDGSIGMDDLKGGCFTITNGGVFGSLLSTPILNPGQSAILGMHAIVKRPVAVQEQIALRPMMYLALSYDHRVIDGREAVQFLVHLKQTLEDPSRLLLDV